MLVKLSFYIAIFCCLFVTDVMAENIDRFNKDKPKSTAVITDYSFINPMFDNVILLYKEKLFKYNKKYKSVKDVDIKFQIAASYFIHSTEIDDKTQAENYKRKSVKWFERAAKDGHGKSKVVLARIYNKRGNLSKSFKYYLDATKADNPPNIAFYEVANIYDNGIGRYENIDKAFEYYTLSAEKNIIDAHYKLSEWYINGVLGEQDFHKAIKHLLAIAEVAEDYIVRRELFDKIALLYSWLEYEGEDTAADQFHWLFESAKVGGHNAMSSVARAYMDGRGVEMDMKEAIKWYKKLAKTGNAKAMSSLAYIYANGLNGVREDLCEAQKWYTESAEQGNADAAWNLGNFYMSGLCGKIDLPQSKKWFDYSIKLHSSSQNKK